MEFKNLIAELEKQIAVLRAVNGTLNGLSMAGRDNWMKVVGCMNAVDDVVKKLEEMKHDQDREAEGRD
ncbi:MAG: hypothetical protein IKN00_04230 [Bacteroidales bacterium]|nr:hypothetical protein [Bacteroidales bacterium]